MPGLIVDGNRYEVSAGKRLVKALTEDAGTDQLHACGGKAKCTTCRVEFISGNPDRMTEAEKAVRQAKGITDPSIRLSCQVQCDTDMEVRVISRLAGSNRIDAGSPVADQIEPAPVWAAVE